MSTNNTNQYQDVALRKTAAGYFDISFDEDGDFFKTKGLDTALLMTIFEHRRADESQIAQPEQRNGWLGNNILDIADFEIGSLLWLLYEAKADQATLNFAKSWTLDACQWLITDGYIDRVEVDSFYDENTHLNITIKLLQGDKTITKSFNLWENTRNVKF